MSKLLRNLFALSATAIAAVFSSCAQTVSAPSQESAEQTDEPQEIYSSSSSKAKSSSSAVAKSSDAKSSSSAVAKSSDAKSSSSTKTSLADIYGAVESDGIYTTRDSVAAYLCKFDKLPGNYVGKDEGKKLYEAAGNTFSKWNFNPWTTLGVMIGGDTFNNFASNPNNYHATLPEGNYREADVEYSAKNRGTKRLVYQAGCVIYYTADHYETYTRLKF